MKKIVFLLMNATVAMLTLLNMVIAQKSVISYNSPAHINIFLSPFEQMGFGEMKANNINIKAVRDFVKTFQNVTNGQWVAADDGGFISTFNSDGIKTIVAYDRKGSRQYIMRVYAENKLSFDIRHMVKREYYDATITLVKEFETNNGLIIFVHIQDKDTWKIVRIADGEMQLVENFNKG